MSAKEDKIAEDLYIALKFPPVTSTSGVVFAKRAINNKKPIDVVQGQFNGLLDYDFNEIVDELIDNRIVIDVDSYSGTSKTLEEFRINGLKELEKLNKEYKTINTRCFPQANAFLAFEYKAKHPETLWIAEFSDPLRVNLENRPRGKSEKFHYHNQEFIELINSKIEDLSQDNDDLSLELVKEGDNTYFIAEYLIYLFADKVIFTNPNQQEIMLSEFPIDLKDFVMKKSEIMVHPTLSEEYYHIREVDYEVDKDCINLGYFGTYLAKRNFEAIYYAMESLDDDLRHKVKFHIFTSDDEDGANLRKVIKGLDSYEDIIINDKVPLLESLNISTKLDVLIVNDSLTKGFFRLNPFLPSKFADYWGSGNDIWAICEEGSVLESLNEVKYKSYIDDYSSSKDALERIIEDRLNVKTDKLSLDEDLISQNSYLKSRVNYLNLIMPKTAGNSRIKQKDNEIKRLKKENEKLKKENKKLKKQNKEILNSNSWKLTKVLRKTKGFTKKD